MGEAGGADEQLSMVKRGDDRVLSGDGAAHAWENLPRFEAKEERTSLVFSFETETDRDELISLLGLVIEKRGRSWSAWWPAQEKVTLSLGL